MARPKGRKNKKGIPEPLVPRTPEVKLEEAKAALAEKILDPANITPEKMPNIAGLDSYGKFLGDDPPSEQPVPPPPPPPDDFETSDNGGVVEMDPEPAAVEVTIPPPSKKSNNYDNLKVYNKLKDEISGLKERLETAESELEDTKRLLDATIAEKNAANAELLSVRADLEKARKASTGSVPPGVFEKLKSENEDLLLKNSELELEVSILRETSKKTSCDAASVRHTYSPQGYAGVPPGIANNTRPAMNGYQDWI